MAEHKPTLETAVIPAPATKTTPRNLPAPSEPAAKRQKVPFPGSSPAELSQAALALPGPVTAKISTTDLNAAITAAISENFAVVDQRVHQAGVELIAAVEAMQKHLIAAMSLFGQLENDHPARTQAEDLCQEITNQGYEDVIKRASNVFGCNTGGKVLVPRNSIFGDAKDSCQPLSK
jgi:hypothetical protein